MTRLAATACAALLLGGCAMSPAPNPSAGASRGAIPSLTGVRVMVVPVQAILGVEGDVEAELVFALQSRGPEVRWSMPATVRTQLARNPMLDVPLETLPVSVFLRAEVNRVGDPLYGYLRRIAAISGATLALIPIEVRQRAATADRPGAVEVVAVLINVVDGRVAWFGVVQGDAGDGTSPAALASAADQLARILLSNTV